MSADLAVIAQFLSQACGFELGPDKHYQLQSRLTPLVEAAGLADFAALARRLEIDRDGPLARSVIDAIAHNETYFFRDRAAFAQLRDVALPKLIESRGEARSLRIWCAACSTGQEPYSIAMLLDEYARRLAGWRVEIFATDLSERALEIARAGAYSQFEVQRGLPIAQLMRYFRQEGDRWKLNEFIRSAVTFRRFNLLDDFSRLGTFDMIICRNVLIYFDVRRKSDIFGRLSRVLAADGFFVLGTAESPLGLSAAFTPDEGQMGLWRHAATRSAPPAFARAV